MRYVESKIKQDDEDLMYRNFITEGLKIISKNTATFEGSEVLKMNFYEFINRDSVQEPKVTKEEVVNNMKQTLAALGGEDDSI